MKKIFLIFIAIIFSQSIFSQNTITVEVTAKGTDNKDARTMAKRDALEKALGTKIVSQSNLVNMVLTSDQVITSSSGYIVSFDVLDEGPTDDDMYQVHANAVVSLDPLQQDADIVAQLIGGLKFIVLYDPRGLTPKEKEYYEFAYERMNEKLNVMGYERTEASLFKNLVSMLNPADTGKSFMNNMGLYTNSEFIIWLKNIEVTKLGEVAGNPNYSIAMEVKAYDNCNWRNLSTIYFKANNAGLDEKEAWRNAISTSVDNSFDRLMMLFNNDIAKWIHGGSPYELRFFGFTKMDDYDWFDYEDILAEDIDTKEDLDVMKAGDYCVIKMKSLKTRRKFISWAYRATGDVPNFKVHKPSIDIRYGRQFSLSPKADTIPELQAKIDMLKKIREQ